MELTEQALSPSEQRALLRRLQNYTVRRIDRLEASTVRRLYELYAAAAADMTRALQDAFLRFGVSTWSLTDVGAQQRQIWLLQEIVQRMDTLAAQSGGAVRASFEEVFKESYYMRGWQLAQVLPLGRMASVPLLPEQAIIAAMTFPYEGSNFFQRLGDARNEFIRKLRNSITVSQIEGEGIYQAQKRLARELGWPIARRRKAEAVANKGNFARTEMIARTELLRASNLGAAAVDQANSEIVKGWEWVTARDERVCLAICAPRDGMIFALDSPMGRPPGSAHPNCRCTSIPVRKTNKELGLPEIVSPFGPRQTYAQWKREKGL